MPDIKVQWFEKEGGLGEIYQFTQMQFAFLSAPKTGSKQCHPFVLCRDFLHDAVRASVQNNSCSIYGFNYNAKSHPPIDLKRMRMMVTSKNIKNEEAEVMHTRMRQGLRILNHYESLAGWVRSKLTRIKDANKPNVWLFSGPSNWMKTPYLVSMYTFLIRLGDKYGIIANFKNTDDLVAKLKEVSEMQRQANDNDVDYIKQCYNKMHLVVINSDDLFLDGGKAKLDPIFEDPEININTFHNNCGIWSLCSGRSPKDDLNQKVKLLK